MDESAKCLFCGDEVWEGTVVKTRLGEAVVCDNCSQVFSSLLEAYLPDAIRECMPLNPAPGDHEIYHAPEAVAK